MALDTVDDTHLEKVKDHYGSSTLWNYPTRLIDASMLTPPHLEFNIPPRMLHEYWKIILNERRIKATRGLWSFRWHIERPPIG